MLTKYRHKNITDKDLAIPGIGIVKAGEEVETDENFNNANFTRIKKRKKEDEVEITSNKE